MLGIWPLYKTIAHLNLMMAGLIAGAGAFMGEGMQVLFGIWSDRGWRKLLIFSGLILTFSSILFIYTPSYFVMFFFYLLTCIGSGAFHPSAAGLVAQLTPHRKGLLIGLFVASGAVGMATSQWLYMFSASLLDGHMAWSFILPIIVCLVAFLVYFPSPPISEMSSHSFFDHFKSTFALMKKAEFRFLYFTQVASNAIFWGTVFLLPDILYAREYPLWISFGAGHLCFILGAAVAMAPAGYLADKFSAKTVILTCHIMAAAVFYAFIFQPALSIPFLLIILFAFGSFVGVLNPLNIALANQMAPASSGAISAFVMGMAWCVAECIGPGGGAFLTRFFTEDAAAKALGMVGGLFAVGFFAALRVPKIIPLRTQKEF
jgi:FSR family fosmidomycin resistance protein-like MFS transporter